MTHPARSWGSGGRRRGPSIRRDGATARAGSNGGWWPPRPEWPAAQGSGEGGHGTYLSAALLSVTCLLLQVRCAPELAGMDMRRPFHAASLDLILSRTAHNIFNVTLLCFLNN